MSNKQETLKMQTCVLRVNILCHCDGCKKKIRKLLQKIDGVYSTQVNAEQGRVTVTGNVDPAKLIKTLEKSGKHAELWRPQNLLGNFKNMQIGVGNGAGAGAGKDKFQKGGGKGQQQQQHVQFKGPGTMKMMPNKLDQKNVKYSAQEGNFYGSDGEFGGDFDEDGGLDDDYKDGDEEFGGHHGQTMPAKLMPMKGNSGQYMPHGPGFSDKKGRGRGGGNGKKGGSGAIEIPVLMKGKGRNNDGKNGNGGKKGKSGQGKDSKNGPGKGGKDKKKDGKDKTVGKSGGGGLLGFLKRSKSGRKIVNDEYDCDMDDDMLGGGGGKNNGNGGKKGGGKGQVLHDINNMKQGFDEFDGHSGPRNKGQMGQMGKMGPMGPVGPMGNYGRMGDMPEVQGHQAQPGMSSGYYNGVGPANPYSQQQQQQQQYMAMLMNQQQMQNGNDMYQPMMYTRPHPAVNYMPPPMPPPPAADPLTHIFSDENTESCSIM